MVSQVAPHTCLRNQVRESSGESWPEVILDQTTMTRRLIRMLLNTGKPTPYDVSTSQQHTDARQ